MRSFASHYVQLTLPFYKEPRTTLKKTHLKPTSPLIPFPRKKDALNQQFRHMVKKLQLNQFNIQHKKGL